MLKVILNYDADGFNNRIVPFHLIFSSCSVGGLEGSHGLGIRR